MRASDQARERTAALLRRRCAEGVDRRPPRDRHAARPSRRAGHAGRLPGSPPVASAPMAARGDGAFVVREAREGELEALGRLMVSVYSSLEGFPDPDEQPRYYELLGNIGRLAGQPDTKLL